MTHHDFYLLPEAAESLVTSIDGLFFEGNFFRGSEELKYPSGVKLLSSEGSLISDFVTHESTFRYGTFGIHVGQTDRLTFLGYSGNLIRGYFVDCRENSKTLHLQVEIHFTPSHKRKLIIPRGVAHTFDGLAGVVTRDEPVWYVSEDNADWDIDNDLIAVKRDTSVSDFPVVRVNEYLLPEALHQFQSRLSQELLRTPKPYLSRTKVIQDNSVTYEYQEPDWGGEEWKFAEIIKALPVLDGIQFTLSNYALTGPHSYTLVPNTHACVCDVLLIDASAPLADNPHVVHLRTRMILTFLNNEGETLIFSFRDMRSNAVGSSVEQIVSTTCDPRMTILVEPGISYAFHCPRPLLIRLEQEVFADEDEPRVDLPMFGQDSMIVDLKNPVQLPKLPALQCPPDVVRLLAKTEISEWSTPH